MFNSNKFTLQQVELEFGRVEERHHTQLKIDKEEYNNSPEAAANIRVMDILGATILDLRESLNKYKKEINS
jgi:hypothetical protein